LKLFDAHAYTILSLRKKARQKWSGAPTLVGLSRPTTIPC
jgi:hypothetical protein